MNKAIVLELQCTWGILLDRIGINCVSFPMNTVTEKRKSQYTSSKTITDISVAHAAHIYVQADHSSTCSL